MLKKLFTLSIILGLSSLNNSSKAQTSSETITLQKAVEIALENNFQIKQAENNLEASEFNVFASKMNLFTPDVNGSLRFGQTQGRQFNNVTGTIIDQITTSSSGGINASITLFDGFRNINTLRNANSTKISQQERLKRAKEDLIFNVASQYLAILLDNQLLTISKENLTSSSAQLNLIKAQVEVGSRPVADLYNQESIVSNNELNILQRENTLNNDKLRLIRILQIDPSKEYTFEIPELSDVSTILQLNFNDLLNSAINNRSDLKAQKALIEANRINYKSSIGQHYPTISLNAGLNTNYNDRFIEPVFDANNNLVLVISSLIVIEI
jgi:outer membrane protein